MKLPTKTLLPVLAAFLIVGCDFGTEPESFNQIDGNYSGTLTGTSQGVTLNSTFSLAIIQTAGDLSGSYSLSGTLSVGAGVVQVQDNGNTDGSIQRGNNPSVNITVTPFSCPNQTAQFSGSYDTANSRLTISGPVEILDDACQVILTYNSTIVLNR